MDAYELDVRDLGFSYAGGSKILDGVSLKIGGPQLISIIGPNGVGKSTFIYCLNKILSPTEGTVLVEGEDVKDISIKNLSKKMGFVPHATSDVFPMTVMDTVLMGRHPHSGRKITDEDVMEAYNVLKLLDIGEFAMRPFDQLSAGQHQKVVLARGLVQKPRILLLDEPTSNLDIKHQMDVTRILKELSEKESMTVVMISHDLNIAARYSDRVVMMYDHGIYCMGTPEEVITEENISHVYKVESKVVMDDGRPYVILRDSKFSPKPAGPDSVCSL
ncbi:MAG: ABC transporter ATP-binding protein [Candidatus Methanomethylophilaceae archaeon]|nr:ABC transporter ATP-binding protein [Candidatus Methanomethylophilaceae archaeon]